ncbi:MAG TPA: 6-phosphogluconolactonase [Pirellulales bacterium]|jgi:6-phosphogluconolactonase|nr:6-phosphogluconolactonase [Pirellulales bacterium]
MAVVDCQTEVLISTDATRLAAKAAELIAVAAKSAIARNNRFTLVLSGGSTPERTYKLLPQAEAHSQIDWSRTWLFFGDERCVPHDDSRSNYRLAADSLLQPARIDPQHVLPINTAVGTPAECAESYAASLRQFFGYNSPGTDAVSFPSFDLILLGLGDDGHTASLFPGKPSLDDKTHWVTWSPPGVLPPPVDRVTFTFPLINAARQVMFLVSGDSKAKIVQDVIEGPADPKRFPSSGVKPIQSLTWLLDEPAARLLIRQRREASQSS